MLCGAPEKAAYHDLKPKLLLVGCDMASQLWSASLPGWVAWAVVSLCWNAWL
ncbi:hypothetical protein AF72_08625 [Xylella taiwanensis]|uniref:Uncharacterized protein n=1 Tax=Xylella taiwanensis TaxID=1444770 RepID=Z9JJ89_9GAMM|nr:hypothetical protein AF72_08625 [Xylella taiwanensis]